MRVERRAEGGTVVEARVPVEGDRETEGEGETRKQADKEPAKQHKHLLGQPKQPVVKHKGLIR